MLDGLAAGVPEVDAGALGVDAAALEVEADVLGVEAVEDGLDEHPAIRAAIAAIATPPATMRARLGLNMVLTRSLERKAFGATVQRHFDH